MKILYLVIDGEITGGNIICLRIIEEALRRGHEAIINYSSEGKFTEIIREKGLKAYNIDTRRSFYLGSAIKLAYIIKKEGINLAHSHTHLGGAFLIRLGGWLAGVPVITHAHLPDTLNANPFVKKYQFLLNWISSRFFCSRVIAVSENVKKGIIKQGIDVNKIAVVYNGVDSDNSKHAKSTAEVRQEFGLKQNQPIVGEVGRLCESKGQHILIKAAGKVVKHFPEAVFMVVGEDLEKKGEYKKKLMGLAEDLGLKQQIIFAGYRPDICDLMNTFNLFVLSSATEGLPVVILEAMAVKNPVITTPVGGNLEVVIDGETGTIIPLNDANSLAEAIIHHLENPGISKKMGQNGHERVKQYFSLSQMTDKIMDIYKKTLDGFDYDG